MSQPSPTSPTPFVITQPLLMRLAMVLWLAVIIAAVVQVNVVHWQRGLLSQWQQHDDVRQQQQQEYTRLLLEKSALTAHGRIETQAREQLNMIDPPAIKIIGAIRMSGVSGR